MGSGLGLLIAYLIDYNLNHFESNPPLYFSLIAIGGGAGLIVSYLIEMKELRSNRFTSSPRPSQP